MKTMQDKPVEIKPSLFWSMYNALRDAEGVLWECDGATNPENENLTETIADCQNEIARILDLLQPIVSTLKEDE